MLTGHLFLPYAIMQDCTSAMHSVITTQATTILPVNLISLELAPTPTVNVPFGTVHAFPVVSQYDRSFLLSVKLTVALPPALMLTFSNPRSCRTGEAGAEEGNPM
jgi:hypothetical protein